MKVGRSGLARFAAPIALFLVAFQVRALPWQSVLMDGRVYPFGNDVFYHLRRVLYSLRHFPESLGFDPYLNFPEGARAIWTPAVDWTIAALLRPFATSIDAAALERIVIWLPPLLGAATVVALYGLARRHFGTAVALVSASILSVLSGHFAYSQIGFFDHHVVVSVTSTAVLATSLALVASDFRSANAPVLRRGVPCGIALGVALLVWPGSLVHVGLALAGLLVFLVTRYENAEAVRVAHCLVVASGVALLLVLPGSVGVEYANWGRFSPVVHSGFQPWLFGMSTALAAACGLLWRRGLKRPARLASALGVGVVLLFASFVVLPEFRGGFGDAWQWLAKEEVFQSQVAESQPLFYVGGRFHMGSAVLRLSYFIFLFPAAVVWMAYTSWGRPDRNASLLLVGWSSALFVLTLLQKRFFNSFSVSLALLMGWSLCRLYLSLPDACRRTARARAAAILGVGALGAGLLAPTLSDYEYHFSNLRRLFGSAEIVVSSAHLRRQVAIEMADWIRRNTPVTAGWLDTSRRPEYGVLAPWSIGHILGYVARRPTVTGNFGDDLGTENFAAMRAYYKSREPEAVALLDRLQVRYVIAQGDTPFSGARSRLAGMGRSLYEFDGSLFVSKKGKALARTFPALEHHRLIYDSRRPQSGSEMGPIFKVFEYVPGAHLVGRAAPGATVRISVRLETNRSRKVLYAATAVAAADGRYAIRVPYANRGGPPAVRVAPSYTVSCRGQQQLFEVQEIDVAAGREVIAPDVCRSGSAENAASVRLQALTSGRGIQEVVGR